MSSRRVAILALLALGCGRPPPVAAPLDSLDGEEEPSQRPRIAGVHVPTLPEDVRPDDPELEAGWEAADTALRIRTPTPPDGELWEVEGWANDDLANWLRRRGEAVARAQHLLEPARQGEDRYSVVASYLIGVLFTRFAYDVRGIDTPSALRGDEERSSQYRRALEESAEGLLRRASTAFGSCASVAAGAPLHSLETWRRHCDEALAEIQRFTETEQP